MVELFSLFQQAFLVTTITVIASSIAMMAAPLRRSRWQGLLLLVVLCATCAFTLWQQQEDGWWLLPIVAFFPFVAWVEGREWVWTAWARINGACLAQQALASLGYEGCLFLLSAHTLTTALLSATILFGQVASLLVSLPLAFDVLNVLGRRRFPARDRLLAAPEPARWPSVCVQVPAYNEPAELLAATIRQLLRQDYPGRWMIQVIDNNTPSPLTWLPVWDLCRHLGERVQFVHLHNWPGFKAGALNEGTRRLPAWVEVVAVVDADYLVAPDFLRATARHFADPRVAFVQTPQHYREWRGLPYFESLNFMYETFFATYMPSRRETNSLICAGTMGLVRRSALEAVGLWDEASITEDAEVSVRLLARGWTGLYDHRSYGAGLMPFDFAALKKQRFRWAFGTIQLLKKHWRLLLGLSCRQGHLNLKQCLCFSGLGLQYLIELASFCLALLLAGTSLFPLLGQSSSSSLIQSVAWMPLLLLLVVCVRTIWALRVLTGCTLRQAIGALTFFFALSWVTAQACLSAMLRRKGVFLRTPKVAESGKWQRAIATTITELGLCLGFATAALLCAWLRPGRLLPGVLLLVQATIYDCAPACALAAEFSGVKDA